eukprot:TRINITY_DN325_c0_g1_i2.p1 TRINITY_DN325_c0_g1~~TRINITY_DN325_c0_g1_i2.p1  ORF type:complete len:143 (-),score=16.67 TRINITY_DN325_c0_g1_i2:81-509(-)
MSIPLHKCPKIFVSVADKYLQIARSTCPSIPASTAKICRINYYTKKGKIGWHRDRDGLSPEEQKTVKSPIVSISLGSSGVFLWKNSMDEEANEILLESGDVLVFGGPSRMLWHSVPSIMARDTIPKSLRVKDFTGRFNIGFY